MAIPRGSRAIRQHERCAPGRSPAAAPALAVLAALSWACGVPQRDEIGRLPASYNFAFYDAYPEAARSFYAAHFAHFGVYEALLDRGPGLVGEMEWLRERILHYVDDPPKFEPPAEIIAPDWSKMAWETARAMDWTHMLHSQLYDILSDDRVGDKRSAGRRAIAYYLADSATAFSTRGYGHRWMEGGGAWAGGFRRRYPEINGILWAYHWHHAAVYEALMEADPEARRRALDRVIRVFEDSVLANPPQVMPLTAEVAPRFSRMFPAAAHVFDNLHMMHDVANDVMAAPAASRREKAVEIERMRRKMSYAGQDTTAAPGLPMEDGHHMKVGSMRVPTRLPDGSWLPQGHPEARPATMEELMAPLEAPGAAQPRRGDGHVGHPPSGR